MLKFAYHAAGRILRPLTALVNYLVLRAVRAEYKTFPLINGLLFVRNGNQLTIGKDAIINSNRRSNPIGGDTRTVFCVGKQGRLLIGDHARISNACIYAHSSITIGDNVFIGGSVRIYDSDFHSVKLENRVLMGKDPDIACRPVDIADGTFIGAHSLVLKGVSIGRNSVIGAGSVVTTNVPDNEIWAGNPATFIRQLDSSTRLKEDTGTA